ncbi:MAG: response regulator [Candidatus Moraniibacteriota bacterium]
MDKIIVVVDDNNLILSTLSLYLEELGYEVFSFSFPLFVLGFMENMKLEGKKIDLLISDSQMPKMNGARLIKKAKEIMPNVGVIYMSGSENEEDISVGYDVFLLKPFKLEIIKETVENLISSLDA